MWAGIAIAALIVLAFFFVYLPFMNHTSVNQIGICYDAGNGKIWTQEVPGWYWTNPLVKVAYITTLPVRVTVPSEAKVIVSKMVRFKPEGLDEFIRLQGFSYYQNIENIFLGFAYADKEYPFLEVIQTMTQENSEGLLPVYKGDKK
ncbi:MAG: hypothetical protein WC544_02205 [Patescibacteria group bacterium]